MEYAASLREKTERLQLLTKQLEKQPVIFSKPSCAILLAEIRWEKQDIKDIREEITAFG
jgi:hypothetical protein